MNQSLEYRDFTMVDVKVNPEKRTIVGRTVPYNSMSNELRTTSGDTFKEVIMRGSINESLANNDILALAHHDSSMVLGRTSAGTLKLEDREDGLYCEISVPDTSYGNDLLVSAARFDINGFSFGFNQPKSKNYSRNGQKIREIYSMNLREVSVVANPAYSATTLALRNEDFAEENAEVRAEEAPAQVAVEPTKTEPVKEEVRAIETPILDKAKEEAYALKHRFYSLTHNK